MFSLELAWLGWFLYVPLPNAGNIGGHVRRWMFLGKAVPEVIPGTSFRESYLGMGLAELSHVENLPQRLPVVLASALIVGAAVALGRMVLRGVGAVGLSARERLPLAYGLGMTALGVGTLLAGRLGGLGPWPVRLALGLVIGAEVVWSLARRRTEPAAPDGERGAPARWLGFGIVAGPFLVLMALGSMLPTIDFDAIEYHLQGPRESYEAGRIAFLPHNVYTSMPFGVEMLHLLGMEVLDDPWWGAFAGQLVVASFAPATAAVVALTARRLASPRAAWIAAVVYLTTPWVYRLAVIPYVEGPLCFYHAALVGYTTLLMHSGRGGWGGVFDAPVGRARGAGASKTPPQPPVGSRKRGLAPRSAEVPVPFFDSRRAWLLLGLLAGGAMACKYPALLSAVVPFGVLAAVEAARARRWRVVPAFVVGWAVVMTPWLAKNVMDTGNPVYPLGYRVFGGRHWSPDLDAKWSRAHGPRPVSAALLGESLIDVAGRSDWQSPLYLALTPLALLRPGSRRAAGALWGYVAYLFLTWWLCTHRLDRFWLPLLPPLAVLAGLGADWVRRAAWSALLVVLLGLSIVTNLAYCSTGLVGFNEWTGDLRALSRQVPASLNRPLARLDAELPPGRKVLLIGQAAVFHFHHPIVYNTVFNRETIEDLTRDRTPGQVREAFRERGITDLYVDWYEIERYRSPGNYGFTPYVTRELFARLVAAGVLGPPVAVGPGQEWYRVAERAREPEAWTR